MLTLRVLPKLPKQLHCALSCQKFLQTSPSSFQLKRVRFRYVQPDIIEHIETKRSEEKGGLEILQSILESFKAADFSWQNLRHQLIGSRFYDDSIQRSKVIRDSNFTIIVMNLLANERSNETAVDMADSLYAMHSRQSPPSVLLTAMYMTILSRAPGGSREDDVIAMYESIGEVPKESISMKYVMMSLGPTRLWETALHYYMEGYGSADNMVDDLVLNLVCNDKKDMLRNVFARMAGAKTADAERWSYFSTAVAETVHNVTLMLQKGNYNHVDQKVLLLLESSGSVPAKATLDILKEILNKQYVFYNTKVKAGACTKCKEKLEHTGRMKKKEYDILRIELQKILQPDQTRVDSNTSLTELQQFYRRTDGKRYTAVVDAANIYYRLTSFQNDGPKFSHRIRSETAVKFVRHLHDQLGGRVLLVARHHLYSAYRALLKSNDFDIYYTNSATHDDLYVLLGALNAGPECYFVSDDVYREYTSTMKERTLFQRYQRQHQISAAVNIERMNIFPVLPELHTLWPQRGSLGQWHLPHWTRDETIINVAHNPMRQPDGWLCVQPNQA